MTDYYKEYDKVLRDRTPPPAHPLSPGIHMTEPARDKSEIVVVVDRMLDRMRQLQGALGVLEERLTPVLSPPQKENAVSPSEIQSTSLGTHLNGISTEIAYATDRVHNMIHRLGL